MAVAQPGDGAGGPARTDDLDEGTARWLVDHGRADVDATARALADGADDLPLVAGLRRRGRTPSQAAAVMSCAHGRRRLRADAHPLAEVVLATRVAVEQASRAAAVGWRAARLPGGALVDLCVGAGLDALLLAADGRRVVGVDLDPARVVLANHNATAAGRDVRAHVEDATRVALPHAAHADPSRRDERGRRLRRLSDGRPPVGALVDHWRSQPSPALVVSTTPAVALDDPALPPDAEVAFLQVDDDLVDAVLLLGSARRHHRTAVLLDRDGTVRATASGDDADVADGPGPGPLDAASGDVVGQWLVVPAPALVRARLHDALGERAGLRRASRRRALLLGPDRPVGPWWTARQVVADLPPRGAALRRWLRGQPVQRPVEFALHGLDVDLRALHAASGRPPRGPDGWRVGLVRTDRGGRMLVLSD